MPAPSPSEPVSTPRPAASGTHWQVAPSAGFDALLLLGAAAGDVMQTELYPDEIRWLTERLPRDGLDALTALDQGLRARGHLIGPTLVHLFSANTTDTLEDVLASATEPEERLLGVLEDSPYWTDEGLPAPDHMRSLFPAVRTLLHALESAEFPAWWSDSFLDRIEASVAANREALAPYDVVPLQSKLLGRPLDPQIDVVITHFAKPYGIRVLGQRFLAHHGYAPSTQLRNAAHEMFHPPFDLKDAALWKRLDDLRTDPWMVALVEDHDPKYGYNSFHGLVDEDSTQALDQIVAEHLGVAYDPATRWSTFDGGMHLLAAALYDAVKEDGFDVRGGEYGSWLADALDRGLLTPAKVRRRAAAVAGDEAVARWDRTPAS